MTTNQAQAEVTIGGTLSCIDQDGGRDLTADEFHALISKIADYLDDAAKVVDPCVWGQASTGEMEIFCILVDPLPHTPTQDPIAELITSICEATDLVWTNTHVGKKPPVRKSVSQSPVMWSQTKRHFDLIDA